MPHRLFVNNGKAPRMRHAHRANVHIGLLFIGVIEATAKHLGESFQLCVDFEAHRGAIRTRGGHGQILTD